jgi:dihydrodiol dehydrogenase / D-xylose 1-dehydrogenase (NADP)
MSAAISLHYKGQGIAVLTYNLQGETPEETLIAGTAGRIKILSPGHCPTSLEVTMKKPGRQNTETQRFDYPLPAEPAAVKAAATPDGESFYYPNSAGFQYEAAAVHRCIRAGLTSCPQYPPAQSVAVMRVLDETRQQLGIEPVKQ